MTEGDLISRQAVIDALTKTSGIRGDALKALYDLPLSENKGEWIPTIERLPEIGDTVLCSVKTPECIDHHIIICKYCAEEFWKDGTIRAWQPLPEPYKAEEGGEI